MVPWPQLGPALSWGWTAPIGRAEAVPGRLARGIGEGGAPVFSHLACLRPYRLGNTPGGQRGHGSRGLGDSGRVFPAPRS